MSNRAIILYRINGGPVQAVVNGETIHEFDNRDDALAIIDMDRSPESQLAQLFEAGQLDYQLVELDEL